ncbi:hypothetical protein K440DRAFT_215143 [Wilcoxina mikolae CBS 423.85]|nr:hypothetical protein K440DRAFT_215143 [Wilcoxina mikolae CBS 423.85]
MCKGTTKLTFLCLLLHRARSSLQTFDDIMVLYPERHDVSLLPMQLDFDGSRPHRSMPLLAEPGISMLWVMATISSARFIDHDEKNGAQRELERRDK